MIAPRNIEEVFVNRWDKAFTEMGLEAPDPIVVTRRYGESHRRHHTAVHALTVELALRREAPVVRIAGLLHDVVYNVDSAESIGANEYESCKLALEVLTGYLPQWLVAEVVQHIRRAAKYSKCRTWGDMQLHDADYAILAMNEVHYAEYAFNVREEYSMFSNEQWCMGRKDFLEKLLKSDAIFFPQNSIYEADARANMTEELTQIKKVEL